MQTFKPNFNDNLLIGIEMKIVKEFAYSTIILLFILSNGYAQELAIKYIKSEYIDKGNNIKIEDELNNKKEKAFPEKQELSLGLGFNSLGSGRNIGINLIGINHTVSIRAFWAKELQYNYMADPNIPYHENFDLVLLYGKRRTGNNRILFGVGTSKNIRRGVSLGQGRHTTLNSSAIGLYVYFKHIFSSNRTFNRAIDGYANLNSDEFLIGVGVALNISLDN